MDWRGKLGSPMKPEQEDLDGFIDETQASQSNIVFPNTVRNARGVDAFLWKGSPSPTLVQRMAAWLFGLLFIAMASLFVGLFFQEGDTKSWWPLLLVSALLCFLGLKIFRNGFPRH